MYEHGAPLRGRPAAHNGSGDPASRKHVFRCAGHPLRVRAHPRPHHRPSAVGCRAAWHAAADAGRFAPPHHQRGDRAYAPPASRRGDNRAEPRSRPGPLRRTRRRRRRAGDGNRLRLSGGGANRRRSARPRNRLFHRSRRRRPSRCGARRRVRAGAMDDDVRSALRGHRAHGRHHHLPPRDRSGHRAARLHARRASRRASWPRGRAAERFSVADHQRAARAVRARRAGATRGAGRQGPIVWDAARRDRPHGDHHGRRRNRPRQRPDLDGRAGRNAGGQRLLRGGDRLLLSETRMGGGRAAEGRPNDPGKCPAERRAGPRTTSRSSPAPRRSSPRAAGSPCTRSARARPSRDPSPRRAAAAAVVP